ncbi:MAG: dihydrouridine synthase [Dethiosulfovibrio peptidovorans]|nr:MAG: dihydrouridine synthase [Dethiosulfovibrio peptidovorans]
MLSPLAGVTVPGIRCLFWRLGVGLAHTEMVSCAGLIRENKKTAGMLARAPDEGPLILQLFAGDRDTLLRGAQRALELGGPFDGIGINMACPMPKVLKKGAGARLLDRLDIAVSMVQGLKTFGLPVWPKIRKIVSRDGGPDTLTFASALIEAGADNVGIHGRTASQRYEGCSDLNEVFRVARAFPGFISASGDMTGPESVTKALDGGCVSVFLARGAVADPFVIPRILAYLGYNVQDSPFLRASLEDRAELFAALADDLVSLHGEKVALVLLKRMMSGMFCGVPGCAPYKRAIGAVSGWAAVHDLTRRWRQFFERGLFDE